MDRGEPCSAMLRHITTLNLNLILNFRNLDCLPVFVFKALAFYSEQTPPWSQLWPHTHFLSFRDWNWLNFEKKCVLIYGGGV